MRNRRSAVSQHTLVLLGRNPHNCSKQGRLGDVDPGGVANLSWVEWVISVSDHDLNIGITS